MVGNECFDRAALPHRFRPGTPQPKSFVFYWGLSGQTAFSGNNFDFDVVSKSKGLSASTTIKRECYTLKEC